MPDRLAQATRLTGTVNALGTGPAQFEGRWMVRISIGSIPTERPHLTQLLTDLQLAVR